MVPAYRSRLEQRKLLSPSRRASMRRPAGCVVPLRCALVAVAFCLTASQAAELSAVVGRESGDVSGQARQLRCASSGGKASNPCHGARALVCATQASLSVPCNLLGAGVLAGTLAVRSMCLMPSMQLRCWQAAAYLYGSRAPTSAALHSHGSITTDNTHDCVMTA